MKAIPSRNDSGKPELQAPAVHSSAFYKELQEKFESRYQEFSINLNWLFTNMHPYFFITMKEETEAIINLAARLHDVAKERKLILADQDKKLILARLDVPGSLYDTLKTLQEREISYAEMIHAYSPLPGAGSTLEIQRFEFDRKSNEEIYCAGEVNVPAEIRGNVFCTMKRLYPDFELENLDGMLNLLWLNNESYVRISPPERIARVIHLYHQGKTHEGLYLDIETKEDELHQRESRILFSVGNPPGRLFLTQVSEVFQRLGIGLRRSYCLIINTGVHPYFLGTFYVLTRQGELVEKASELSAKLKAELYNTQILSTSTDAYVRFVGTRIMTGEEASLTNAFISLCHTALAHNQPDRFDAQVVKDAFHSDPSITLKLIDLFRTKFDPDTKNRDKAYARALKETEGVLAGYNTGHRYLDELRKTVLHTCLVFIRNTLKTNFFVPEKHALAFRMDPAFLDELGPEFTSDLPDARPFRITFFFTRDAVGYHVGFSDIARGGWRTIICRSQDEHTTNTNTLFREVYVLAHTQHLKNKDIYQGGSKMTVLLDATDLDSSVSITPRLYKTQYGIINAFLDIFVTENGKAKNPRVVDYYREDEPIELGPDENMHDEMIELIARQSLKRGYILGIGIMSSKRVGINHREYGVTSRGVVKFAEMAMRELGVDICRDSFSVKFTGGPNGDVAGNSMRLILEKCPRAVIRCIIDGTAGLYDPKGADRDSLRGLILKEDLDRFDPEALHPGGFILYRHEHRREGLRELYRKIVRTGRGVKEQWVTTDDFHKEMDELLFSVPSDLFLPCGGRPETIDGTNWQRLVAKTGIPNVKVITEGANSFISPEARIEIQKQGVILLRDASANKCGVISSSYEIIANLLMSEEEFLRNKTPYVNDVLDILEKRAEEEARLIFDRHRQGPSKRLYTDISDEISMEINKHYAGLFEFFQDHPQLADRPLFQRAIRNHLPALISNNSKFRSRVKKLPSKMKFAILAAEIATMMVYHGGWEMDFETRLQGYLKEQWAKK
ncbi:MAG: NAD-glutamate dehydrogenase [Deltaproteobacteria bacterium]|nr:NAD-glutamate dehydrogenase [Deltaproteobacteria bacterium]MBW2066735.1 NAD-glutamate dehydrogenase [Deltaproteobacteria bacterium]